MGTGEGTNGGPRPHDDGTHDSEEEEETERPKEPEDYKA